MVDFVYQVVVVGDRGRWLWNYLQLLGGYLLNEAQVVTVAGDGSSVFVLYKVGCYEVFFEESQGS